MRGGDDEFFHAVGGGDILGRAVAVGFFFGWSRSEINDIPLHELPFWEAQANRINSDLGKGT